MVNPKSKNDNRASAVFKTPNQNWKRIPKRVSMDSASQGDELTSVGDGHDLTSTTTSQQTERSKRWSKARKQAVEVMCGLAIYTSEEEKLTTDEVINKTDIMFKNLKPQATENQRFSIRMRNVMAHSHYISPCESSSSTKNSAWELITDRISEFMDMVNRFIEEKPELAEEHDIKKIVNYKRSCKRSANATSPSDSGQPAVPKKKKRGPSAMKAPAIRIKLNNTKSQLAKEPKKEKGITEAPVLVLNTQSTSHGTPVQNGAPATKQSSDAKSVRFDVKIKNEVPSEDDYGQSDMVDIVPAGSFACPIFYNQMTLDPADIPLPKEAYPFGDRSLRSPEPFPFGEGAEEKPSRMDEDGLINNVEPITSHRRFLRAKQASIRPLLPKKIFYFSPAVRSDILNSDDGRIKDYAVNEFVELVNKAVSQEKQLDAKLSELITTREEKSQRFYMECQYELENKIYDKFEALINCLDEVLAKPEKKIFSVATSPFKNTQVTVVTNTSEENDAASEMNTAKDPPADEYSGQVVINMNTGQHYTILNILGHGSFGKVFKARDPNDRICALKVSIEAANDTEDVADERQLIATMKSLKESGHHPPRFLAVSEHFDGFMFGQPKPCERMDCFALDLYDALYIRRIAFTPLQTIQLVAQISKALTFLHYYGFVHSDIKPDNVMLANMDMVDGKLTRIEARLIDFNVVLKVDNEPVMFCGQSIPYRAPEMALETPCDGKIDVFSLGLIALQMVTGSKGFYVITDDEVKNFNDVKTNAAILGEIQRVIGPIPQEMCQRSSYREFHRIVGFKKLVVDKSKKMTMDEVCRDLEQGSDIGANLASIVRKMLIVDPRKRPTAADIADSLAMFCDHQDI